MDKVSLIFALILIIIIPIIAIPGWQIVHNEYEQLEEESIAVEYLRNSSTFGFDGIEDSINVTSIEIFESLPIQYVVKIDFKCTHAGYGDRTGQILAQVITPHNAKITIVEKEVMNAIIDGKWDMIKQKEKTQSELLPMEHVRNITIQYVLNNHGLSISPPEEWESRSLTTPEIMGRTIHQYIGDNWVINISHPVVQKPIYTIIIIHQGNPSFTWQGTIDLDENIEEDYYNSIQEILLQENARDIAVSYIIESYEKFRDLKAPQKWTEEDLTPVNLVGYSTKRFTNNGWTVNVSNPVVWKPVYQVEIAYSRDFEFRWRGTVDQTGMIEEKN
jgi:hypothetical protein